jgi:hypothetical protein
VSDVRVAGPAVTVADVTVTDGHGDGASHGDHRGRRAVMVTRDAARARVGPGESESS